MNVCCGYTCGISTPTVILSALFLLEWVLWVSNLALFPGPHPASRRLQYGTASDEGLGMRLDLTCEISTPQLGKSDLLLSCMSGLVYTLLVIYEFLSWQTSWSSLLPLESFTPRLKNYQPKWNMALLKCMTVWRCDWVVAISNCLDHETLTQLRR